MDATKTAKFQMSETLLSTIRCEATEEIAGWRIRKKPKSN